MFIVRHTKYPLFLSDYNKTWIFSKGFRKFSDNRFHKNPSCGSRVVACGQTHGRKGRRSERHDETNSRFSQFCECA